MPDVEYEQAEPGARSVDPAIHQRSAAARHEPLVKLVGQRISSGDGEAEERRARPPGKIPPAADGAVKEQGEHRVFGDMRELADEVVQHLEARWGYGDLQEIQNLS